MKLLTRTAVALLAAVTLTASGPVPGSAVPKNPDDKTILHVLNRMGFGARPGDVERVREMGLTAYIDRQLHPDRIPYEEMAARLSNLETVNKSTRQLASEYFEPAMRARREAKQETAKTAEKNPSTQDEGKPARTPEQMEAARKAREVVVEL